MYDKEVHRERVTPCLCPGGLWTRLCTRDKILKEGAVSRNITEQRVFTDAVIATAALEDGETVWLYFYDGDTGECLGTCIHVPA